MKSHIQRIINANQITKTKYILNLFCDKYNCTRYHTNTPNPDSKSMYEVCWIADFVHGLIHFPHWLHKSLNCKINIMVLLNSNEISLNRRQLTAVNNKTGTLEIMKPATKDNSQNSCREKEIETHESQNITNIHGSIDWLGVFVWLVDVSGERARLISFICSNETQFGTLWIQLDWFRFLKHCDCDWNSYSRQPIEVNWLGNQKNFVSFFVVIVVVMERI